MSDRPDISPWEYGKTYETNGGLPCEIIGRDSKGNLVWVVDDGKEWSAWCSDEVSYNNALYPKEPERTVDQWQWINEGAYGLQAVGGLRSCNHSGRVLCRWTIGSDGKPNGCVRLDDDGKPLYRLEKVSDEDV